MEPQKPSLESLLMEMIANQQSINENVEAIYEKLTQLEGQIENVTKPKSIVIDGVFDDNDELYEDAKALVIKAGSASTSFIQRGLRVGYSRAARLMDLLEEKGVIGPADGSKPREVLVDE
jgi:DNA segregation ATPase FtsK/SpoIIIE-like protein